MKTLVESLDGVKYNSDLMKELAELYHYNLDGSSKKQPVKLEEKNSQLVVETYNSKTSAETENKDSRTFFEKYTPSNILAEIKYRLSKN